MKQLILNFFFCVGASSILAQKPVAILEEQGVENAYPRLSKDGKRILYQSNRTGNWQLYILDMETKKSRRITEDSHNNNLPDWNPNDEWIAFVSDRDGNEELYLMKTDGSRVQRLTYNTARDIHPYFSPDGKYILFNSTREGPSLDIYRYTLANQKIERLTNTKSDETCARYSPDMKSIVFLANDDISDDVFVMNMSNGLVENITGTPQVRDGWPTFSNDGKWIYYSAIENQVFHIYRIRPDGTGREQITDAAEGEEDARVFVGVNNNIIFYNKRKPGLIAITMQKVQP